MKLNNLELTFFLVWHGKIRADCRQLTSDVGVKKRAQGTGGWWLRRYTSYLYACDKSLTEGCLTFPRYLPNVTKYSAGRRECGFM